MRTIWKTPLRAEDVQSVGLPRGSKPVAVQLQGGSPTIWWEVEDSLEKVIRRVAIVGTGEPIPEFFDIYAGTLKVDVHVWHFYVLGE